MSSGILIAQWLLTRLALQPLFKTEMDNNKEVLLQLRVAEIVNGRAAMLGFIAALGAYAVTGQIIPGIF